MRTTHLYSDISKHKSFILFWNSQKSKHLPYCSGSPKRDIQHLPLWSGIPKKVHVSHFSGISNEKKVQKKSSSTWFWHSLKGKNFRCDSASHLSFWSSIPKRDISSILFQHSQNSTCLSSCFDISKKSNIFSFIPAFPKGTYPAILFQRSQNSTCLSSCTGICKKMNTTSILSRHSQKGPSLALTFPKGKIVQNCFRISQKDLHVSHLILALSKDSW